MKRPAPVTGLSLFFAVGAAISATSLVALSFPGGFLEPMWRLNPRAHEHFQTMGPWALLLMSVVSVSCATAAVGLWHGRRYGYLLGVALLVFSLLGDLANATLGLEPRVWIGVPIAAAFLVLLTTGRSRAFFRPHSE
jgi:hypothetical protein